MAKIVPEIHNITRIGGNGTYVTGGMDIGPHRDGGGGGGCDCSWKDITDKPDFARVATTGSYTDLEHKPTIPEPYDDSALDARVTALENASPSEQVQANWNETDTTSKAYIQNKPTIPPAYDDTALAGRVTAVEGALAGKADASSLANVATSGLYNDLENKPDIPEAYDDTALSARVTALEGRIDADTQADWNETDTTSPAYIQNKPTIPTPISIDAAMDAASENPVQNKVVLAAIGDAVDVVDTAVQGLDTRVTAVETAVNDIDTTKLNGLANIKSVGDGLYLDANGELTNVAGIVPLEGAGVSITNDGGLEHWFASATTSVDVKNDGEYAQLVGTHFVPTGEHLDEIRQITTTVTFQNGFVGVREQSGENQTLTLHVAVDNALNSTSENPVQNKVVSGAISAIDTRVTTLETDKVTVTTASIPGGGGGEEVTVSVQEANDQTGEKVLGVRYFTDDQGAVSGDPTLIVGNQNFFLGVDGKIPSYIVDKPEGGNTQLGNVVQVGTLLNNDGAELGIYEFYYKTSALPNNTTKEYTLLPLLQDYNIVDFIDGTGVTSNGIFIGNGRTDGTNYLIIQQFSKNRKAVILRTYQDYTSYTALLKIKFLGSKTTA